MNRYDYPNVGIGLFLLRGNKILLNLRKGNHGKGMWGNPGGHLDKFESFESCIYRELKEECGEELVITRPIFWTAKNTLYPEEGKHFVVLFFVAEWVAGEAKVTEPDKCERWEWFEWDKLPPNLLKGTQQILDEGLNPFGFFLRVTAA